MSDDFNARAGQKQLSVLIAARQQCYANLAQYEALDDEHNAAAEVGAIADLNRQMRNIGELAQQENQRINQSGSAPLTDQEFLAVDAGRFKNNPRLQGEVLNKIVGKSKYFDPKKDWDHPDVKERVREGQEKYAADRDEHQLREKMNGR